MSAEELPGQANVDGAPPFLRHNVLDAPRRTDNAGFVDERVEAAERRLGVDKEMSDVGLRGDVSFCDPCVPVGGPVVC